MSRISRRSLLGYSGTATAGAVLGGAATAQPAQAAEAEQTADTTSTDFPNGTLFSGNSQLVQDDMNGDLTIKFSVAVSDTPAANVVSPLEIAEALNELAASKGWPPITFYGTPAPAPLN
ncbi:twin-arginine translocation signal domain-containing protein [Streptomyces sp. NPDC002499]